MKNRWAAGIEPRFFTWVLKDQLAISERPGGYSRNHRRVRRHEEILWLKQEGFTRVVSLLASEHNLHAYEELQMPFSHLPVALDDDLRLVLPVVFNSLQKWLDDGEKILMHREEIGDDLMGLIAGFLLHTKRLDSPNQAISAVEHLLSRQMGAPGRAIVVAAQPA